MTPVVGISDLEMRFTDERVVHALTQGRCSACSASGSVSRKS